jgi:hypothetical protein
MENTITDRIASTVVSGIIYGIGFGCISIPLMMILTLVGII